MVLCFTSAIYLDQILMIPRFSMVLFKPIKNKKRMNSTIDSKRAATLALNVIIHPIPTNQIRFFHIKCAQSAFYSVFIEISEFQFKEYVTEHIRIQFFTKILINGFFIMIYLFKRIIIIEIILQRVFLLVAEVIISCLLL